MLATRTRDVGAPADRPRPGRLLRILLPGLLVVVWFALAGVGGPYFGRIDEVSSNDQASFLPANADATRVGERFIDFVGDSQIPAIIIVDSNAPLGEETLKSLSEKVASLTELDGVDGTSPLIPSEDGLAAQAFVPLSTTAEIGDTVDAMRDTLRVGLPDGVSPQEAQELLRAGRAVIVDVRTKAERQAAHIPGSTHLPLDELRDRAGTLPRDKTIICQCASGMRSASAAKQLTGQGFTTLNLNGGIGGWQAAGLPTK